MVSMAQSAANWHNMHTHMDRTHSLTHLQCFIHSYNQLSYYFWVHAGSFHVSVIHQTLTWTTGSLTCVHDHYCVYVTMCTHRGWAHRQCVRTTVLTRKNSQKNYSAPNGIWTFVLWIRVQRSTNWVTPSSCVLLIFLGFFYSTYVYLCTHCGWSWWLSQAFNWLLRTVVQQTCLHDLLWFFVVSMMPGTEDEEETENAEAEKEKRDKKDQEVSFFVLFCFVVCKANFKEDNQPKPVCWCGCVCGCVCVMMMMMMMMMTVHL